MLIVILVLYWRGLLRDRLFFLYLLSYGMLRLTHEFMRDTRSFGLASAAIKALRWCWLRWDSSCSAAAVISYLQKLLSLNIHQLHR
jgi:prolipoprotein diacylglyceryltransferase